MSAAIEPGHEPELRAVVIEDESAAHRYLVAWDQLSTAVGDPFGAPAWALAWWRHVAPEGARLRVVVVLDRAGLVAVAPLYAERRLGGWTYRVLGGGTSSRVDFLCQPGIEPAVARVAAAALRRVGPRPDAFVFEGVPSHSVWPALLAASMSPGKRGTVRVAFSVPAPAVSLAGLTFDAWMGSRSAHFRARMRRGLRKLEARGGVIRRASPEEVSTDLAAFVDLHHGRWRKRGGSGVLTPSVERMLSDVGRTHSADGRLGLWSIDLDGRTVSVQVFLAAGGEVAYWLGGFDDRVDRLHPGPALLSVLKEIERACSLEQSRLDLGGGGQAFKYEFADAEGRLDWAVVSVSRTSARGALLPLLPSRARLALARRLPPGVKNRVRVAAASLGRFRRRA